MTSGGLPRALPNHAKRVTTNHLNSPKLRTSDHGERTQDERHRYQAGARRPSDGARAERALRPGAATAQSASARSPFTPIADYAFLSNCHTGALVAPDGTVDWLCVPRFDSPSVFGALLDRGAGGFRFGPFGINVPTGRIYEPGTNSLVTSWKTPTGWVVVRDALTMGPRRGEDTVTPHTRPPADEDADHVLVRTAECIDGRVEIDLVCEPAFDYGRVPGEWTLSADRHRAEVTGAEQALQLQTDMLVGIEAGRARARHVLRAGESVYCALAWSEQARVPATVEEASEQLEATTTVLARLAFAGGDPRPRARATDPAVGADHQGPHVHADRGGRRGAHHLAARDPRRGAQLGLPLHVDPRLDLPPARAALPAAGLGGRRVHAVHRRPRAQR